VSTLGDLRAAKSLHDLAAILRYRPSAISFIVYKTPVSAKYTTFEIPKKGGESRKIDAPNPKLKALQKRLADVLYECLHEIEGAAKSKNKLSHAFRKKHSIITNAKAHKARRYVLNLDLENFFPSLNFGRVRGFFLKNNHFKLAEPVATLLAQVACHDGTLPQGSPCSPIISELLTHFLDIRLVKLAKKNKCTYTRYADDITFSTNQKDFPTDLADETNEGWKIGSELKDRIEDAGFTINEAKTRMQLRGSRQIVTGLVVNEKINVSQRYYKFARAMTESFLTTGSFTQDGTTSTSVQKLEGILNHIYHVRERQIDISIDAEFNGERRHKLHGARTKQKNEHPTAIRRIYFQLVFFKHFIDPKKPLVICEGPTDPVYLKRRHSKTGGIAPEISLGKGPKIHPKCKFFQILPSSKRCLTAPRRFGRPQVLP